MIEITRSKKQVKQVSMVPLINVVFLLLIFFLVAGTVEKFDVVSIDLPEADAGQLLDEGHIAVLLGKYNEVVINDELMTREEVVPTLQKQLEFNDQRIITIKADEALEAHRLIDMMEGIQKAGGSNVSIITQAP